MMKEAVKADQLSFCKWFQQPDKVGLQLSISFFIGKDADH